MVNKNGIITTVAGTGTRAITVTSGFAGSVPMAPWSVAVDSKGVYYIADRTTVRKMVCGAAAP
jgi:hypothetical protein